MSSPKREVRDLAARCALKARSDEIALEKLPDDPEVPDDVIGFHVVVLLDEAGLSPPDAARDARRLAPWAVEFRYDDVLDERLDRKAATDTVAQVRTWLDGVLAAASDT